ncbi:MULTISPECIES: MarR family transcriptional regulator [unclassified Pseudonocardia]|jgi:DNA-binding MarR family transcriptional regulator|uniref:MarR family winged helix-turn-helix transcriptional regulator n=1 Tax=unclassified Pseudonocardia TaxID=2619320 RepID=UPI00095CBB90|nr:MULTISPECIES: MarR family transcriptional regulator [unclassified Pseudonocardia]MBN9099787.1 MarR family transcriptional regulator [Pseudonocardia sp.]OJY45273.1 MAG: hypothetical protein BGP03_15920 [Pseudonocardia sp. 73-21]
MPDGDDLRGEIMESVLRFIAGVVVHNTAVAQRVGMGASDLQFVSLLNLNGPLTPGQLAEQTGLTTGTVTGVIDRLEKGGFVHRVRDAGDRRKVLVTPVPEGMAKLTQEYAAHGEHTMAVMASRSAEELRVIAEFLADLNASPGRPPR